MDNDEEMDSAAVAQMIGVKVATVHREAPMTTAYAEEAHLTSSSRLVAAIERTWSAIQYRHADVPTVYITLGPGPRTTVGQVLGHFAARRWHVGDGDAVHELFVGGEGLRQGAVELLCTLLHEAAHAAACARGVKDTSRQGRYHNTRFAQIARELGLDVAQHPVIGWSLTTVPAETQLAYGEILLELDAELTAWRQGELAGISGGDEGQGQDGGGGDEGSTRRSDAAHCGCGRKIRVARAVLAEAPISCGRCGTEFVHAD